MSKRPESLEVRIKRAVSVLRADLLLNDADGCTFVDNHYPLLIIFNPQSYSNLSHFLPVARHEWAHAKGCSEREAKIAEHSRKRKKGRGRQ